MTPTDKVRAALEAAVHEGSQSNYIPESSEDSQARRFIIGNIIDNIQGALSLLEGHVIVPVEPTGTQMIAGGKTHQPNKHGEHGTLHSLLARETYRAMIAPYVKGGGGDAEV